VNASRAIPVMGAVAALSGCAAHPMGYLEGAAGPLALTVQRLGLGFVAIVSLVVLIIAALILLAIARARRAARADGDVVRRGSHGLQWIYWGVGISVPVLVAMTLWSFIATRDVSAAPGQAGIEVEITGHLWWWEMRYRADVPGNVFSTANELVIPTGVPVRLDLTSADVIHDFWVPKLGPKMDLIPGQWNHVWLQADRPGTYLGQCAEYCGLEHARMGIRVVALAPARFAQWRQAMQRPAAMADTRGSDEFVEHCGACHTVRGTQAGGILGPDLTHLASRATLAAGLLPNTPAGRLRWVGHPQALKPGAEMPDIPLGHDDLVAIVDYLGELR
jgi:cytochrome c oxidase subunit 2